jgi:glutathione synthase/RimK-type ligase-like ATP-grasp enzyme
MAMQLAQHGIEAAIVESPSDAEASGFDAGFVRYAHGPAGPEPPLYFVAARLLEELGVPFLNPPSRWDCSVDKLLCGSLLRAARLPHPTFKLVDELSDADAGPFVVKPTHGAKLEGVAIAADAAAARVHEEKLGLRCLAQEVLPAIAYWRIVATRSAVLSACRAQLTPGELYGFDDRCEEVDPPAGAAALARSAVAVLHSDVLGIDLLEVEQGRWSALEANYSFGFGHDHARMAERIVGLLRAVASS